MDTPIAAHEATYAAEVSPSDHTILTDPVTGVELTFLTTNSRSSGIYFHERSWLADGSMVLFRREGRVTGYLVETGELVAFTTPQGDLGDSTFTAAALRNSVFCMRGNDVLELTPTVEISSDPASAPSRVAIRERYIATLPLAGQINGNYDDTYLSAGLRGTPPTICVIGIDDGSVREVGRFEPPFMFRGHVKWSRTASNLLSFSAGPDWHREGDPQHARIMDPEDGVVHVAYHQVAGELFTHDSWWVDDQILFCGAPPAAGLPGDPTKRELSHVNALDTRTGVVRIIGAGSWWPDGSDHDVWKRNWWHCAGSDDGRWVVADTFSGDIVLFEGSTTRPRLLTSGHRTHGVQHAEPGWDRAGEKVIFSSHMISPTDEAEVEPRACVAAIPADWQEENSARFRPGGRSYSG